MDTKVLSSNIRISVTADNPDDFNLMYNFTSELFKGIDCSNRIEIVPRIITKSYIGLTIDSVITDCSVPGDGVVDVIQVINDGASVLIHSKLKEPIVGITEFQIEFKYRISSNNVSKPNRKFYLG